MIISFFLLKVWEGQSDWFFFIWLHRSYRSQHFVCRFQGTWQDQIRELLFSLSSHSRTLGIISSDSAYSLFIDFNSKHLEFNNTLIIIHTPSIYSISSNQKSLSSSSLSSSISSPDSSSPSSSSSSSSLSNFWPNPSSLSASCPPLLEFPLVNPLYSSGSRSPSSNSSTLLKSFISCAFTFFWIFSSSFFARINFSSSDLLYLSSYCSR